MARRARQLLSYDRVFPLSRRHPPGSVLGVPQTQLGTGLSGARKYGRCHRVLPGGDSISAQFFPLSPLQPSLLTSKIKDKNGAAQAYAM
jgi:hypothetical protein